LASIRELELSEKRMQRTQSSDVNKRCAVIIGRKLWHLRIEIPFQLLNLLEQLGVRMDDMQRSAVDELLTDRVVSTLRSTKFINDRVYPDAPDWSKYFSENTTAREWVKECREEIEDRARQLWRSDVEKEIQAAERREQEAVDDGDDDAAIAALRQQTELTESITRELKFEMDQRTPGADAEDSESDERE